MSDEQPEPEPVVVTVTAYTGGFLSAMRRAESGLMFAFHPDLSTPAEREAHNRLLHAIGVGLEFQDRMRELHTQAGASAQDVQSIRDAVLRLAEDDGEQRP